MFLKFRENGRAKCATKVKKRIRIISLGLIICILLGSLGAGTMGTVGFGDRESQVMGIKSSWDEIKEVNPESLIRFHVVANSDSQEDQRLKYAVRDAILEVVAPRLAMSQSLEESRKILKTMENEFMTIARGVIHAWGRDDIVSLDYGFHLFPTKSYGNIVLPAGEYEAVKIQIGKAEGANWWCVLFPPLCFVNVKEATTLPVDGKAGVPLGSVNQAEATTPNKAKNKQGKGKEEPTVLTLYKGNKVGFFFERFLR